MKENEKGIWLCLTYACANVERERESKELKWWTVNLIQLNYEFLMLRLGEVILATKENEKRIWRDCKNDRMTRIPIQLELMQIFNIL